MLPLRRRFGNWYWASLSGEPGFGPLALSETLLERGLHERDGFRPPDVHSLGAAEAMRLLRVGARGREHLHSIRRITASENRSEHLRGLQARVLGRLNEKSRN